VVITGTEDKIMAKGVSKPKRKFKHLREIGGKTRVRASTHAKELKSAALSANHETTMKRLGAAISSVEAGSKADKIARGMGAAERGGKFRKDG
jgi:hypothetical protein